MGTIEFHGWGSKIDKVEYPDRLVFDLDPDVGLDFAKVKEAAVRLKALLGDLGLKTFPLLSGGKGLHVVVPLDASKDWPTVKSFAERFSRAIAEAEPEMFTANIRKVAAQGPHLPRLAAQPARRDGGHALFRARPRRRARVGADRVGRARQVRGRQSLQHPRCGRTARARRRRRCLRAGARPSKHCRMRRPLATRPRFRSSSS